MDKKRGEHSLVATVWNVNGGRGKMAGEYREFIAEHMVCRECGNYKVKIDVFVSVFESTSKVVCLKCSGYQ